MKHVSSPKKTDNEKQTVFREQCNHKETPDKIAEVQTATSMARSLSVKGNSRQSVHSYKIHLPLVKDYGPAIHQSMDMNSCRSARALILLILYTLAGGFVDACSSYIQNDEA